MGRVRDSQRSKVYAAENRAFPGMYDPDADFENDLKAVAKWIDEVLQKPLIRTKYPKAGTCPEIKDGRSRTRAAACAYYIKLPRFARNRPMILHELAHVMNDRILGHSRVWFAGHGPEFVAIYLDLVEATLGLDKRLLLGSEFLKARVKVRP